MGTNKDEWRKELLEHVDPDSIPSNCGGAITSCFNVRESQPMCLRVVILLFHQILVA